MPISRFRLERIAEAMQDMETVFTNPGALRSPGSYDPRHVQDYAVSLASEFVGDYRDDELTAQLVKLVDAEDAGDSRTAGKHLRWVRKRVAERWSAV